MTDVECGVWPNGNALTDDAAVCSGAFDSLGSGSTSWSSDECKHSGLVCRLLPVRIERDDWLQCSPSWSVKNSLSGVCLFGKTYPEVLKKPNSQFTVALPDFMKRTLSECVCVRLSQITDLPETLFITPKCVRLCDSNRGGCMGLSSTVLIISLVIATI